MVNSATKPNTFQPQVFKIDIYGNIDWQRTFNSNSRKHHHVSATSTQSGDLVIVGSSTQDLALGQKDDAFIVRIDLNGNILWTRPYGTADYDDWGWSVYLKHQIPTLFLLVAPNLMAPVCLMYIWWVPMQKD